MNKLPHEVGQLTMYQVRLFTASDEVLGASINGSSLPSGSVRMSAQEYKQYLASVGGKHKQ